jgi:hypothetical protein
MASDPTAIQLFTDPLTQRMRGVARHGNTPFDVPFISHIEGNLWQGGCAMGLVLPKHILHVVSLYPWEQYTIQHQPRSTAFHWLYDDLEGPKPIVHTIATYVANLLKDGPTLLHCQAGLNRSSLIAALVLMKVSDRSPREAIDFLRAQRSPAVLCNPSFEKWLLARD